MGNKTLKIDPLARLEPREELRAPVAPMRIGPHTFWPPVFPAPMCGISDRAQRYFARQMGCPLVYTQMVSSEAMSRGADEKCWNILDLFLEPGPVCAQVFGSDPERLAETARRLQDAGATIVDLNMGCPVNKVVKNNGGSALMTMPDLVARIFKAMRSALTVPFTVKFRAGWEMFGGEALTIARMAREEGLDAIAVHARTRKQGYEGNADWNIFSAIKAEVDLPLIGNGDIRSANDAVRVFRDFAVDGIMLGRGCMGNPWVFREIIARLKGEPDPPEPTVDERLDTVLLHAEMMVMRKGEGIGLREFRKHVVNYMKAFPFARDMKTQLLQATTMAEYRAIIDGGRDHVREWAESKRHEAGDEAQAVEAEPGASECCGG